MGLGGGGGLNSSASFQPRFVDVEDAEGNHFTKFDGRLINPLSIFSAGAVQLLGKEMTAELQILKVQAVSIPEVPVQLITKEIEFGTITADQQGNLDISDLEEIDEDLIVKPFGRKGERTLM